MGKCSSTHKGSKTGSRSGVVSPGNKLIIRRKECGERLRDKVCYFDSQRAPLRVFLFLAWERAPPSKTQKALPQGLATAISAACPLGSCSMRARLVKLPFACASVKLKRFAGMAAGRTG